MATSPSATAGTSPRWERPSRGSRGRPTSTSSPASWPRSIAPTTRRVLESRQGVEVVEQHVTPKGETLYVHTIKTPIFGPDGEPIGIQGIFWDVTERMRAEEQLKENRIALQKFAQSAK